jgi:hypothetical protein
MRNSKSLLIVLLTIGMLLAQENWGTMSGVPATLGTIYTQQNAPATPALTDLALQDSISHQGIVWHFSVPVRVGQFINRDWYVVGACTVTHIDPHPLFGNAEIGADTAINRSEIDETPYWPDSTARNGSVLNQPVNPNISGSELTGYDSRVVSGNVDAYSPSLFAHLPIALSPYNSLISTISKENITDYTSHGKTLHSASILTCVAAPMPADAFRPSYRHDSLRTIYYARNLNRSLLHNLTQPANAPNINEWIRKFQKVWFDHVEFANCTFPEDNEPEYGQWHTWATSKVSLMLHLNYPDTSKEKLLINFIQRGIDLYGLVRAGYKGWPGHGGYGGGRYWAIVFAGIMLNDAGMQDPVGSSPGTVHFGELEQTSYGTSWYGHTVLFESHPRSTWRPIPAETYHPDEWSGLTKPKNGVQANSYRICCTSNVWSGEALTIKMMHKETVYNYNAFLDYVDRWMAEDLSAMWDTVNTSYTERIAEGDLTWGPITPDDVDYWKTASKTLDEDDFEAVMWDTYRDNLPQYQYQKKQCIIQRIY